MSVKVSLSDTFFYIVDEEGDHMKRLCIVLIILCLGILAYERIGFSVSKLDHEKVIESGHLEKLPAGVYDIEIIEGEVQIDLQSHMKKGEVYKNYLRTSIRDIFPINKGVGKAKIRPAQRTLNKANSFVITQLGNYQAGKDIKSGTYRISAVHQSKGEIITCNVLDQQANQLVESDQLNKKKDTTELVIKKYQWLNIAYENSNHKPLQLKVRRIKK